MAVVRRLPSTGAPTADAAAAPVYEPSSPYTSAQRWTVALRSPMVTGQGTYTGTIAIPRGQTGPLTAEQQAGIEQAALLGAAQRAQRAGLPAASVPALADIFLGRGSFPDFEQLAAGTGFGGVYVDPETVYRGSGPGAEMGGEPGGGLQLAGAGLLGGGLNMWILLSVAGLAAVLLFGKSGKRR